MNLIYFRLCQAFPPSLEPGSLTSSWLLPVHWPVDAYILIFWAFPLEHCSPSILDKLFGFSFSIFIARLLFLRVTFFYCRRWVWNGEHKDMRQTDVLYSTFWRLFYILSSEMHTFCASLHIPLNWFRHCIWPVNPYWSHRLSYFVIGLGRITGLVGWFPQHCQMWGIHIYR